MGLKVTDENHKINTSKLNSRKMWCKVGTVFEKQQTVKKQTHKVVG